MLKPKYFFIVFIVFLFFGFNYTFYNSLKINTDTMINTYVYPFADGETKELLQLRMKDRFYFPADIDYLNDYSFQSYKNSLIKKDLLSSKMKNVMLLNFKLATNDMVDFSIKMNYLINLCMIFAFVFALFFKEHTNQTLKNQSLLENSHEPTLPN